MHFFCSRIWKLRIRSVQESDAGCYMCQINTEIMKKQVGCIDVLSKYSMYSNVLKMDLNVSKMYRKWTKVSKLKMCIKCIQNGPKRVQNVSKLK